MPLNEENLDRSEALLSIIVYCANDLLGRPNSKIQIIENAIAKMSQDNMDDMESRSLNKSRALLSQPAVIGKAVKEVAEAISNLKKTQDNQSVSKVAGDFETPESSKEPVQQVRVNVASVGRQLPGMVLDNFFRGN